MLTLRSIQYLECQIERPAQYLICVERSILCEVDETSSESATASNAVGRYPKAHSLHLHSRVRNYLFDLDSI